MSNKSIQTLALISLLILIAAILASCKKEQAQQIPITPQQMFLMLKDSNYYRITDYYDEQGKKPLPETMQDDSIQFSLPEARHISTFAPCRTTYVYWRLVEEGTDLKLQWFNIPDKWKPALFTVAEVRQGEYFVLKTGNIYTKYSLIQ